MSTIIKLPSSQQRSAKNDERVYQITGRPVTVEQKIDWLEQQQEILDSTPVSTTGRVSANTTSPGTTISTGTSSFSTEANTVSPSAPTTQENNSNIAPVASTPNTTKSTKKNYSDLASEIESNLQQGEGNYTLGFKATGHVSDELTPEGNLAYKRVKNADGSTTTVKATGEDNGSSTAKLVTAGVSNAVRNTLTVPEATNVGLQTLGVEALRSYIQDDTKRLNDIKSGKATAKQTVSPDGTVYTVPLEEEAKQLESDIKTYSKQLADKMPKLEEAKDVFEAKQNFYKSGEYEKGITEDYVKYLNAVGLSDKSYDEMYGGDTLTGSLRDYNQKSVEELSEMHPVGQFIGGLAYSLGNMLPGMAVSAGITSALGGALSSTAAASARLGAQLAPFTNAEVAALSGNAGAAAGLSQMFASVYSGELDDLVNSTEYETGAFDITAANNKAFGDAVVEVGTELLGGGIPQFTPNGGLIDNAVEATVKYFGNLGVWEKAAKLSAEAKPGFGAFAAKTFAAVGKALSSPEAELLVDIGSEAVEEGLSEFLGPSIERATINPWAEAASIGDIALAGLGGALTAGFLQTGKLVDVFKRETTTISRISSDENGDVTVTYTKPNGEEKTLNLGKASKEELKASGLQVNKDVVNTIKNQATAQKAAEAQNAAEATKMRALVFLVNRYMTQGNLTENEVKVFDSTGVNFGEVNPTSSDYKTTLALTPTELLQYKPSMTYDDVQTYINDVVVPTVQQYREHRTNNSNLKPEVAKFNTELGQYVETKDGVTRFVSFVDYVGTLAAEQGKTVNEYIDAATKDVGRFSQLVSDFNAKKAAATPVMRDNARTVAESFAPGLAKLGIDLEVTDDKIPLTKGKNEVTHAQYQKYKNNKSKLGKLSVSLQEVLNGTAARVCVAHEIVHAAYASGQGTQIHEIVGKLLPSYGMTYDDLLVSIPDTSNYKGQSEEKRYEEADSRFLSLVIQDTTMLQTLADKHADIALGIADFIANSVGVMTGGQQTSANDDLVTQQKAVETQIRNAVKKAVPNAGTKYAGYLFNPDNYTNGKGKVTQDSKKKGKAIFDKVHDAAISKFTADGIPSEQFIEKMNDVRFIRELFTAPRNSAAGESGFTLSNVGNSATLISEDVLEDIFNVSTLKNTGAVEDYYDYKRKMANKKVKNPVSVYSGNTYLDPEVGMAYIKVIAQKVESNYNAEDVARSKNLAKSITGNDKTVFPFPGLDNCVISVQTTTDSAGRVRTGFVASKINGNYLKDSTSTPSSTMPTVSVSTESREGKVFDSLGFKHIMIDGKHTWVRNTNDGTFDQRFYDYIAGFSTANGSVNAEEQEQLVKDAIANRQNKEAVDEILSKLPRYDYKPGVDAKGNDIDSWGLQMSYYNDNIVLTIPEKYFKGSKADRALYKDVIKPALRAQHFNSSTKLGTASRHYTKNFSTSDWLAFGGANVTAEELKSANDKALNNEVFVPKQNEVYIESKNGTFYDNGYVANDGKVYYKDGTELKKGDKFVSAAGNKVYIYGEYEDVSPKKKYSLIPEEADSTDTEGIVAESSNTYLSSLVDTLDSVTDTSYGPNDIQVKYVGFEELSPQGAQSLREYIDSEDGLDEVEYIIATKTGKRIYDSKTKKFDMDYINFLFDEKGVSGDVNDLVSDVTNKSMDEISDTQESGEYELTTETLNELMAAIQIAGERVKWDSMTEAEKQDYGKITNTPLVEGNPVFRLSTSSELLDQGFAYYDKNLQSIVLVIPSDVKIPSKSQLKKLRSESKVGSKQREESVRYLELIQWLESRGFRSVDAAEKADAKKLKQLGNVYVTGYSEHKWRDLGLPTNWDGKPDITTITEDAEKKLLERDIAEGRRDAQGNLTGGEVTTTNYKDIFYSDKSSKAGQIRKKKTNNNIAEWEAILAGINPAPQVKYTPVKPAEKKVGSKPKNTTQTVLDDVFTYKAENDEKAFKELVDQSNFIKTISDAIYVLEVTHDKSYNDIMLMLRSSTPSWLAENIEIANKSNLGDEKEVTTKQIKNLKAALEKYNANRTTADDAVYEAVYEKTANAPTFDSDMNYVPEEVVRAMGKNVGGVDEQGRLQVFDAKVSLGRNGSQKIEKTMGSFGEGFYLKKTAPVAANDIPGTKTQVYANSLNPLYLGTNATKVAFEEGDEGLNVDVLENALNKVAKARGLEEGIKIPRTSTETTSYATKGMRAGEEFFKTTTIKSNTITVGNTIVEIAKLEAGNDYASFVKDVVKELGYDGIVTADGGIIVYSTTKLTNAAPSVSAFAAQSDGSIDLTGEFTMSETDLNDFIKALRDAYPVENKTTEEVGRDSKFTDDSSETQFSRVLQRMGSEPTPTIMRDEYAKAMKEETLEKYLVSHDDAAVQKAQERLDKFTNLATAFDSWQKEAENGKAFVLDTKSDSLKVDVAYALLLHAGIAQEIQNAYDSGKPYDSLVEADQKLMTELALAETRMGQGIQVVHLLNKLNPEYSAKFIEEAVRVLEKKFDSKIKLNGANGEDLLLSIKNAKTAEEKAQAMDIAAQTVANQLSEHHSWTETARAWRYFAMLFNPATHAANMTSNTLNYVLNIIPKDIVAGAIEDVFAGKLDQRTKTLKGLLFAPIDPVARQQWNDINDFAKEEMKKPAVLGQLAAQGKYAEMAKKNPESADFWAKVYEYYNPFGTNAIANGMMAVSDWNSAMLEKEDIMALKPNFELAFRQYMMANGYTVADITEDSADGRRKLNEVRQYAIAQAQEATYRNLNKAADLIKQFENKLGNVPLVGKSAQEVVSAIIPFKNVPANFFARGIEYSPAGLGIAIYDFALANKQAQMAKENPDFEITKTFNDGIDMLAKGLTGSSIFVIGMLLRALGLLKGGGSDDDRSEYYDQMLGNQQYALTIPGVGSVTIDRILPPSSVALFAGVSVMDKLDEYNKTGETDITPVQFMNYLGEAFSGMADPLVEMTFLQGVEDILSGLSQKGLKSLPSTILTNYAGQFVPTLGTRIESIFDPVVRSTYAPKDANETVLGGQATEKMLRKQANKIPGLSEKVNAPSVDNWGNIRQNTVGQNVANIVVPMYFDADTTTEVDRRLQGIFEATDDRTVLPTSPSKYFSIDEDGDGEKETVYLDNEEYYSYSVTKGKTSFNTIEEMMSSDLFSTLNVDEQAQAVKDAYTFAALVAKYDYAYENGATLTDTELSTLTRVQEAINSGLSVGEYYIIKRQIDKAGEASKQVNAKGETIRGSIPKGKRAYCKSIGLSSYQASLFGVDY